MTGKITVLDGGMSRELLRLGARLVQPEWSALALMESPEIVRQVHSEFIEAGADAITTNSYALVPFHIGEDRFREQGPALIALSGQLARQAADACTDRKVLVCGSLPPIFGSYEPENFDPATVQDYLAVLVTNLAPHVDIWLGETLSLIAEAEAVRTAVQATGKPLWISFTLADGAAAQPASEPRLRSGEPVAEAAQWAAKAGVKALLFNCSQPQVMEAAVRTAAKIFNETNAKVEIGVYANAFEAKTDTAKANEGLSKIRSDLDADAYLRFARDWVAAGATLVGGCCGIGVEQIEKLASDLKG
ncbi:MAG: homocysteine S-methyltransferase family protein [Hoeflea sp.]|nr:homocysteine S-methyltransferase family protein [Hoeflea sp.]